MRKPIRRATPVLLAMDADALELLRLLSPSTKRYGSTLSELVRQEMTRREERRRVVREMQEGGPQQLELFGTGPLEPVPG
jgi:hypothetical protein